jgi:hypothetical protein
VKKALRLTLAARQEAMRKKAADKAAGIATGGPGMPLVFVDQLAPMVRKLLTSPCTAPGPQETLADAMISAIKATEQVILALESSPEERVQSSNTLFWLFSICQRHEQSLARAEARKAEAEKNRAFFESRKAKSLATKESVILKVAKERRKIDRKLRKAQAEIAAAAPQATSKEI